MPPAEPDMPPLPEPPPEPVPPAGDPMEELLAFAQGEGKGIVVVE